MSRAIAGASELDLRLTLQATAKSAPRLSGTALGNLDRPQVLSKYGRDSRRPSEV